MGMYGCVGVYMGMYGYVWVYMGIYGYVWVCMGMYGYVWVYIRDGRQTNFRHGVACWRQHRLGAFIVLCCMGYMVWYGTGYGVQGIV